MKKIVCAWIEQILVFPTMGDYQEYIADLNQKPGMYRVIEEYSSTDGIRVRIRKQYNNNAFPDGEAERKV
jgi:hypothetical protein